MCAALNITGAIVRHVSMITGNFLFILIGNIFVASAQFTLTSCIGIVSNKWFAEDERNLSSTLMMNGANLATILCSVFTITLLDQENFEQGFNSLMNTQTISLITCSLLSLIIIKNQPNKPPSKVSMQEEAPLESISNIFDQIFANKNMCLIILATVLNSNFCYITMGFTS
jgi:Na+/melibiose symporter-like transporter